MRRRENRSDIFSLQLKALLQRPILHMEVTSKNFSFLIDNFFPQLIFLGYLVTHHWNFSRCLLWMRDCQRKRVTGWTKLMQDINFLTDLEILLQHERCSFENKITHRLYTFHRYPAKCKHLRDSLILQVSGFEHFGCGIHVYVCLCIHVNFLPWHCKFLSVSFSSCLALFLFCAAVEAAAVLSFGLVEWGPGKCVMVLGHTPQAGRRMEPQAAMQRHASRVLERGRLKRDERNSWRKRAAKRRAGGAEVGRGFEHWMGTEMLSRRTAALRASQGRRRHYPCPWPYVCLCACRRPCPRPVRRSLLCPLPRSARPGPPLSARGGGPGSVPPRLAPSPGDAAAKMAPGVEWARVGIAAPLPALSPPRAGAGAGMRRVPGPGWSSWGARAGRHHGGDYQEADPEASLQVSGARCSGQAEAVRGRLRVPVPESDPRAGRWAGGPAPFCPQKGELKPPLPSDLEAEGVAGHSCGAVRRPQPLSWPLAPGSFARCPAAQAGRGLGVPGVGGSHRVSHGQAPRRADGGRPRCPRCAGGREAGESPTLAIPGGGGEQQPPRSAGWPGLGKLGLCPCSSARSSERLRHRWGRQQKGARGEMEISSWFSGWLESCLRCLAA